MENNFNDSLENSFNNSDAGTNSENNIENPPVLKQPGFYSERYNRKSKGIRLWHLILVAVMSSIIGGGIVFTAFQFVVPAIEPSLDTYFGKLAGTEEKSTANTNYQEPVYKKVEIEKSETPITAIAEKVSPSVVGIRVKTQVTDWFFGTRIGQNEGSGIIISEDGYILTNEHVIQAAFRSNRGTEMVERAEIQIFLPGRIDEPYKATVVGRDDLSDLAVLKIDETGLPAAELGDSDKLRPGELAVAIGNPGGLDYMGSVTAGIISGINRKVETDGKTFTLIQTDAAINPGNSGGALVNSEGKVIGVNTIKVAAPGFEGLGFAIPINKAKEIASDLIEHNYVKGRPFLGVNINNQFTESIAKANNVPMGLLIEEVMPLSGAHKAGIKPHDIITKFNGVRVKTFEELEAEKNKHAPGDIVEIEVYRISEKKTLTFNVELGENQG